MYDTPTPMSYNFDAFDFGAATQIDIPSPDGAAGGVIRSVQAINMTEAITGAAALQIGAEGGGDPDKYLSWVPSALAIGASEAAPNTEGVSGVWKDRVIPAGEGVRILQSASTTGIGLLLVVIDWNIEQPRVSFA